MRIFELEKRRNNLTEAIKLSRTIIEMMEDGIEWEPQPGKKGVKGVTSTSGEGERSAKAAQRKVAAQKLNDTWKRLIGKLKRQSGAERKAFIPHLQKMATRAQELNFKLDPDPRTILGRPSKEFA